jgi:GT2 family glycosyltransferase
VDHGSKDGTPAMLAKGYRAVQVIPSRTNLGFAGGANLGVAGFRVTSSRCSRMTRRSRWTRSSG